MCECIVCALSVVRQVAKKFGFLLLLQCAVCWCARRGLWNCKYDVYVCEYMFPLCTCVEGKGKLLVHMKRCLKEEISPVHLKDLDCSCPLLYTQAVTELYNHGVPYATCRDDPEKNCGHIKSAQMTHSKCPLD